MCPGQQTPWIYKAMFWGNKRREDPPDSVSVFGSVGFWLLEPGLVASNRDPHPTYGTGPKKGNEVHFKPSVLVQWDLSRTTCQFGPLTAILLAWILGSRVLFQSGERLGRRVPWRPPRSHVPNQNDQILQWQPNLLPSGQMQNLYLPTLLLYSRIQNLELFTNYTKISWH